MVIPPVKTVTKDKQSLEPNVFLALLFYRKLIRQIVLVFFLYNFARPVGKISFTCKRILTDKNGWKQLGSRNGQTIVVL